VILVKRDPQSVKGGTKVWREPLVWAAADNCHLEQPLSMVLSTQPCICRARALAALDRAKKPWRLAYTWKEVLRVNKGVYLLACPRTREHYMRSAYGEEGFIGRWSDYVATNHGGNVGLKTRDPSDYFVSILEVAGSSASADEIISLEETWKKKLHSRLIGLN
jgi:hypothetical protein